MATQENAPPSQFGDEEGRGGSKSESKRRVANAISPVDEKLVESKSIANDVKGAPKRCGRSPSEILSAMRDRPSRRLATRLAPLDAATMGGLPYGLVTVIVGAPDAGKTSLAAHFALAGLRVGLPVRWLAADGSDVEIMERFVQLSGGDAAGVERSEDEAIDEAKEKLDGLGDIRIFGVHDRLDVQIRESLDRPSVIIVDSIQTAETRTSKGASDARARVDDVLRAARTLASEGHVVVLLSESNRAGYASKKKNARSELIAVAKESSAIEYLARVFLAMVRTGDRKSDVAVCKAKGRGTLTDTVFSIQIDPETSAVSIPGFKGKGDIFSAVETEVETDARTKKIDALIREALSKKKDYESRNELAASIPMNRKDVLERIGVLCLVVNDRVRFK